jgi:hypothetical protein
VRFFEFRRTRNFVGVAGDGKERSEEFWASYPLIPHRTSPFDLIARRHVLLIRFIDRYFEMQFTETIVGLIPRSRKWIIWEGAKKTRMKGRWSRRLSSPIMRTIDSNPSAFLGRRCACEEIFRLFYRETVLRENSTVPGNSEMKLFLRLVTEIRLPNHLFLLFRPCQREPWREFSVRREGILVFTEKSSRLIDRKNEKALKKTE